MNIHIKGGLPPALIREKLVAIERDALGGADIDDLSSAIAPITAGYLTSTTNLYGPFYRGRKFQNLSDVSSVSDLWYPPASVTPQGRVNEQGKPVFYCSATHDISVRELDLMIGDRIVVLKCSLVDPDRKPHIFAIGNLKSVIRTGRNTSNRKAEGVFDFRKLPDVIKERALLLDGFFARIFSAADRRYFNLVNAVARFYMRSSEIDGISYPSVKSNGGYNLALKADAADKLLQPESISSSYLEKDLQGDRLLMRRDYLADIRKDKSLSWFRSVSVK